MIKERISEIRSTLPDGVTLVCITKFHPVSALQEAYDAGERDFGESRVQELVEKQKRLPQDIRWHFIGHLQTNKVRQIIPFVHLIHSVDSLRLLEVISSEAQKAGRVVDVLLEFHVAAEASKTGFAPEEAEVLQTIIDLNQAPMFLREYPGVRIVGLMGMATNTDDTERIRQDFSELATIYRFLFPRGGVLSMGMSEDFPLAISEGSNMIRIGSLIFGIRQ